MNIKQTTMVLLMSMSIASSLTLASNPLDGIWCEHQPGPALYEQKGLGDNGSDLSVSSQECFEMKTIEQSSDGLGGVGRYITVQQRPVDKQPAYKVHPMWSKEENQFTSVGLFSYMSNFDESITINAQDLIDENRHSMSIYKNNEFRSMASRTPDQYDKTKARVIYGTYYKKDNLKASFEQRWQDIYHAAQEKLQGKIKP